MSLAVGIIRRHCRHKYCSKLSVVAVAADDDRVSHHSVLGMFREWLFGESDWTIETLSKFNYRNTPDFLKEAFADYPYRINDIMNSLAE